MLVEKVVRALVLTSPAPMMAVNWRQRSSNFHSALDALMDSMPSMASMSKPFLRFDSVMFCAVSCSMGLRNKKPTKNVNGNTTNGTMATGIEIMPMTTMNKSANGTSAKMNKVLDVKKLRTDSNCRTCDAKVPTVRGRASMRMSSALPKKIADNS